MEDRTTLLPRSLMGELEGQYKFRTQYCSCERESGVGVCATETGEQGDTVNDEVEGRREELSFDDFCLRPRPHLGLRPHTSLSRGSHLALC